MTHIEIYNALDKLDDKIKDFAEENASKVSGSVPSLYEAMIRFSGDIILERLLYMEDNERICLSCFYMNLDSARKAIHRYFVLEKEQQDTKLLKHIQNVLNTICLELHKSYKSGGDCSLVENTAYEDLQDWGFEFGDDI